MHITVLLVITYIASCVAQVTRPWRYFQLNAAYFCRERGIFSKLELDQHIPERWRLTQVPDRDDLVPDRFPVFSKPEWGQNSTGVQRADDIESLNAIRRARTDQNTRYLIQEAAPAHREFEIFSIDADPADGCHDVISVTETLNDHESYPVNSKHNHNTRYRDITHHFSREQQARLAEYIGAVGQFGIARMNARAEDEAALLAGDFKIVEINLFLPMPINLLDSSRPFGERWRFIRRSMWQLARATARLPEQKSPPSIFFRTLFPNKVRASSPCSHSDGAHGEQLQVKP